MAQPFAFAGHLVERQEAAPRGQRVLKIGTGRVGFVMAESAAGQRAIVQHPAPGGHRARQNLGIAVRGVKRGEALHHPAVLAGVQVLVDRRDATRAPLRIVEREVILAVLPPDEIGILADVIRPLRRKQERVDVAIDVARGVEVARVVQLQRCQRIDAHGVGLHEHDFFEMRVFPVAVGGVLIDPAPDRIDQVQRAVECLRGHSA